MKKVLFILGSYFPKPSPNGICVNQVANQLIKDGVKVSILATQSNGLNEFENIDGAKVYRVKGRWINNVLNWCEEKENQNSYRKYIKRIILFINKLKNILFFPVWPLISPLYSYRLYKKAKYLQQTEEFDAVISVYAPIDALIAGTLVKKNNKKLKLFLYFLDNLSGGIPPRPFNGKWLEKRGFSWEKRFFKYADRVYIMESHRNHYLQNKFNQFKSKIVTVDIPLMRDISSNKKMILNSNKINLVYTGSLSKKVKNPKYLLELYKKLNKNKDFNLHFFGGGDCQELIELYQKHDNTIITYGKVDVETVYSVLQGADILINIGSSVDTQIPSKIFEYIAVGKPILSFYKTPQEPSIPYLKKYPLSLLMEENWSDMKGNVSIVEKFIENNLGKIIQYNQINNLFQKNMPKDLADKIINEII